MEKSMLNATKSDRLKRIVIRNKTKTTDIPNNIKSKKWRWAGYLVRAHAKRSKRVTW